jgi:hypothetical protein
MGVCCEGVVILGQRDAPSPWQKCVKSRVSGPSSLYWHAGARVSDWRRMASLRRRPDGIAKWGCTLRRAERPPKVRGQNGDKAAQANFQRKLSWALELPHSHPPLQHFPQDVECLLTQALDVSLGAA